MLNITVVNQPYALKNSFNDFTVAQYIECVKVFHLPLLDRVNKYTGIPIDVLSSLAVGHFNLITDVVAFIEKPELLLALSEPYMLPNPDVMTKGTAWLKPKQVGEESFGKMERAKKVYLDLSKLVKVYTGAEIENEPLLQHWAKCMFYKESIEAFFERHREMNAHEYSPDEIEAGVETLAVFGHWPVVFRLGKDRGMTNDEVLNMSANEIYTQLLFEYRQGIYADNLKASMKEQAEHLNQVDGNG